MKKILLTILCLLIVPAVSIADFTDNGDGTITDNDTGLIWMQASADTDSDGTPDEMNWESALSYCANLSFAGADDWRLPNNKELQSIVDYGEYNPSINTTFFPDTISAYYWSSTSYLDNFDEAWAVYFYYGYVYGKPKTFNYYVRAVRGNPNPSP